MEKIVILEKVEITAGGLVFLKLQKQVVDGGQVISKSPHRSGAITTAEELQIAKEAINAHLVSLDWPEPSADEWARAEQLASPAFA